MTSYQHIVFFQGSDADEPLRILEEQGIDALADYVCQWDCGDGPEEDGEPWGSADDVHRLENGLCISVNRRLGYVGACRECEEV